MVRITFGPISGYHYSDRVTHNYTKSVADWQMRTKRPLREPVREEAGPRLKNYITPAGLQRLKDEHRFLLNRERPAVVEVVSWAASNGDRSENDGYARSIRGFAFSRSALTRPSSSILPLRGRGQPRRASSSAQP
jgi:hypothetical protein